MPRLLVPAGAELWSQQVSRYCGGHLISKDPGSLSSQAAAGGGLEGTLDDLHRSSGDNHPGAVVYFSEPSAAVTVSELIFCHSVDVSG